MTNFVASSTVERMELGKKFFTDALVQLNLISKSPEAASALLDGSLEELVIVDRVGRELKFEVASTEIESLTLVSNPDEDEMYIDLLGENVHEAMLVPFTVPTESKKLFTFENYTVAESILDGKTSYFLINTVTNNTYEIILETCFVLMSRYLNEDEHYILLSELTSLEDRVVSI